MIKKWLPVLLWTAIIFNFSTDAFSSENTSVIIGGLLTRFFPGVTIGQIELTHLIIRKGAHWAEYLILSLLLLRALDGQTWSWRSGLNALLFVCVCAAADELHQAFVPSRSAMFSDVLIDLFGGGTGVLLMYSRWKGSAARKQNYRN